MPESLIARFARRCHCPRNKRIAAIELLDGARPCRSSHVTAKEATNGLMQLRFLDDVWCICANWTMATRYWRPSTASRSAERRLAVALDRHEQAGEDLYALYKPKRCTKAIAREAASRATLPIQFYADLDVDAAGGSGRVAVNADAGVYAALCLMVRATSSPSSGAEDAVGVDQRPFESRLPMVKRRRRLRLTMPSRLARCRRTALAVFRGCSPRC